MSNISAVTVSFVTDRSHGPMAPLSRAEGHLSTDLEPVRHGCGQGIIRTIRAPGCVGLNLVAVAFERWQQWPSQ